MSFDGRLLAGVGVMAAVVDAGSFVRAAESLGLTQSGVSRAVARLEQRIGVRLFHRTPRQVALTDEGRRFYDEVAPLLAGIEEATAQASGAAGSVRGRLRICTHAPFSHHFMMPRLYQFMDLHPELSIELLVRDQLVDLVSEGIDVAVWFGEPESSALTHRLLFAPNVVTCAAPSYLAKHPAPQTPQDLLRHECLRMRNPLNGRPFEWELQRGDEKVEVPVHGRFMVNDGQALIEACIAGRGITQMFAFQAREMFEDGRLVHLLPEWSDERFPIYFYHRSRQLPPAKVRAFLDFLSEMAKEQTDIEAAVKVQPGAIQGPSPLGEAATNVAG